MKHVDPKHTSGEKRSWQTPKLQELGNIRRFVKSGEAKGKSGSDVDGSSKAGNEAMNKS